MDGIISRLILCAHIIGLTVACGTERPTIEAAEEPRPVPAPAIIDRIGVYSINGGAEVFTVEHLPMEAFGYRLGSADNIEKAGIGIIGDPSLEWFFHNATGGSLWAYVEPEGVTRWTQNEQGKWLAEHYDADASSLPDDMPMAFYERLPKHEKSRWVPDPEA